MDSHNHGDITPYADGDDRKRRLLEHYREQPIQRFLQIDASHLARDEVDFVCVPDRDGDVVFYAARDELQASSWDIRIRIPEGRELTHLGRLLHKIVCFIEAQDGPFQFNASSDDLLGVGAYGFSRITDREGDEGERYPGWYDYEAG